MKIEEIKKIAKEGQRDEAIAMLQRMLDGNEERREDVLLELGIVYYAKGDAPRALNYFNEVARINPEHVKAKAYIEMINGILDYYCKDLLNP